MTRFRTLGGVDRPLLDVYLDPARLIPQTCLVDTGAAAVRLSAELARAAGTVLPSRPTGPDIRIAGARHQVFEVDHELVVIDDGRELRWSAAVTFCDPWPHPFGLLGMRGFLDVFDLDLRAADRRFDLRGAA